jgi:hypothetical protein
MVRTRTRKEPYVMARSSETTDAVEPGTRVRRRLGEAAGSLGHPLREITGENVTVIGISFEEGRKVKSLADDAEHGIKRGDMVERTCAIVTVESSDVGGTRYFTFSPSLVEKLRVVDTAELPMDARFVKVPFGDAGQEVWNVE